MDRLAAFGTAGLLAACLDLSAPTDGIESISTLRVAYTAVVAGDTLRDSAGVARRLGLIAFTGRGDTVLNPEGARFFVVDTGTAARIEDGYLIAGSRLGPVRIVGQVPGLQTPPVTIQVVPVPTQVRADPATAEDTVSLPPRVYGIVPSVTSDPLRVRVLGLADGSLRDVDGWLVRYHITRQPQALSSAGLPAYLVDDQARAIRGDSLVAVDTTAGGLAARRVVLRPFFLARETDTVIVEARVHYHGVPVPGSPVVFRVPFAPAP